MNNNLILSGKIAAKTFFSWLIIIFGGGIISLAGFITGIVLWSNNTGPAFAGVRSGILGAFLGLFLIFVSEFWTALLCFGSLGCLFFYASFASKYATQKAIYLIWEYKLGNVLASRLDRYLGSIWDKKKKEALPLKDATMVKQAIMQEVKKDPENNKIQKRVFQYIMKRIRLDDIRFSDPESNIRAVIIRKVKELISDKMAPSMLPFWVVLLLQVGVLVMALVFDHH